jgi:hypothetical protein
MMTRTTRLVVGLLIVALLAPGAALGRRQPGPSKTATPSTQVPQATPTPTPDPNDPIVRIKDEGLKRSQVMETLSYLSDVIGPDSLARRT